MVRELTLSGRLKKQIMVNHTKKKYIVAPCMYMYMYSELDPSLWQTAIIVYCIDTRAAGLPAVLLVEEDHT